MTVDTARMHEEDHQGRWLSAVILAPLGAGAAALFGGRIGSSLALGIVGATAMSCAGGI